MLLVVSLSYKGKTNLVEANFTSCLGLKNGFIEKEKGKQNQERERKRVTSTLIKG